MIIKVYGSKKEFRIINKSNKIPTTRKYLSKKWLQYVKTDLKINCDLYSLKHKNLDEIADELDMNDAAGAAGHSTPVVTMKHYAITTRKKLEAKQKERLKKVTNKFG